jgi:hypothetical protein
MGQSPFEGWRDKVIDWARKIEDWDKPAPKKGPATAKQLGWADQTEMRKLTPEGPKLGQKKKTAAAKKKAAAKKR